MARGFGFRVSGFEFGFAVSEFDLVPDGWRLSQAPYSGFHGTRQRRANTDYG
jgi:hypothetical protein